MSKDQKYHPCISTISLYLLRNSAHPAHCSKAIPFGVATRVKSNCSTPESFDKRSTEYQSYLINRGYNPNQVKQQFEKVSSIPREDLLAPTNKESKKIFPLVLDYNPNICSFYVPVFVVFIISEWF